VNFLLKWHNIGPQFKLTYFKLPQGADDLLFSFFLFSVFFWGGGRILYRRGRFEAEQPKRKQSHLLTPTKYDEHPPPVLF